tara:strand:+ start:508 stop:711 length:204 start_codon:yes stop_codon:yes gene_type:complete
LEKQLLEIQQKREISDYYARILPQNYLKASGFSFMVNEFQQKSKNSLKVTFMPYRRRIRPSQVSYII